LLNSPATTGINNWWTYEEDAIPGIGKYMANVGNGNLVVQADDMTIPHKGIGLTFRRTYNSLSQHDYFGTDGAQTISNYGAGWTNTFDAHLAQNSGCQGGAGLSVFDIDGARYDYCPDGAGHWISSTPGQFATLIFDGGDGYQWTKKSGTVYYFYEPTSDDPNLQQYLAYAGRLYKIIGRNSNAYLQFTYAWTNGDATCSCNLSNVYVTEEDGRAATLAFADFTVNGQPQRLLSSLTWPDGTVVGYSYDTNGNLAEVDEPPNNTSTTECGSGISQCLPQLYTYYSGGSLMYYAIGPRFVMSAMQGVPEWTGTVGGGYVEFVYDSSNNFYVAGYPAYLNPTPNDGTNAALQPGIVNGTVLRYAYLESRTSSSVLFADTDGHVTQYYFDSGGRVTQASLWTGSTYLSTTETWDLQNNLLSATDASGNETDYAYDNNGNVIAVGQPLVSNAEGTFRPTGLYSYDPNNNVIAYCDPHFVHTTLMADWSSRPSPSDSLCPSQPGVTLMSWSYPGFQQFGELQAVTSALGYHHYFGYDSSLQGGSADFGLPTSVTGDSISQNDGSIRTPTVALTYNGFGNLVTYWDGVGGSSYTDSYGYDGVSRVTSVNDADGATNHRTFYSNGDVATAQSPSQAIAGVSTTFLYDADDNPTSETHYHGCVQGNTCTPGTTTKWYDGYDRLIEVKQPQDPSDYASFAWMTRYIYDLSQNGPLSLGADSGLYAHGGLYATEEYLNPNYTIAPASYGYSTPSWQMTKGSTFDAIDRKVANYDLSVYQHAQTTNAYDQSIYRGLLTTQTNAFGQSESWAYDASDRSVAVAFADGGATPGREFTYDADSRPFSVHSDTFGTLSYSYDAAGNILSVVEPSGGGLTGPSMMSYGYYADGKRASISVAPLSTVGLSVANLYTYSYRTDGLLQTEGINWSGTSPLSFTYTAAGRPTLVAGVEQFQYDRAGRITSGPSSPGPIVYDDEGTAVHEPNTYFDPNYGEIDVTHSITTRGEIRATLYGLNSPVFTQSQNLQQPTIYYPMSVEQYANGYGITEQDICTRHGAICSYANGAGSGHPGFNAANASPSAVGGATQTSISTNTTYDSLGRNVQEHQTYIYPGTSPPVYSNTTFSKTYDFENHLIAASGIPQAQVGQWGCTGFNTTTTASYGWGPNGHPVSMQASCSFNGAYGPLTLHWDGDSLLYTTDQNGSVTDIKIGTYGDVLPSGGTWLYLRNLAGHVIGGVASDGSYLGASIDDPYLQYGGYSGNMPYPDYVSQYGSITEPSDDALWDGANVIQGARSYDPQSGVWTTPDPNAGIVSDPVTQKPYMWNRDNPFDYADPSGAIPEQRPHSGPPAPPEANPDDFDPDPGALNSMFGGTRVAQEGPVLSSLLRALIRNAVKAAARGARRFANSARLRDHFLKHAREFNYETEGEYEKGASDFAEKTLNGEVQTKIDLSDGTIRGYDAKTNTFISISKDGTIKTFFKPAEGEKYFRGQPGSSFGGLTLN
jgi:YD repeat-containing protein